MRKLSLLLFFTGLLACAPVLLAQAPPPPEPPGAAPASPPLPPMPPAPPQPPERPKQAKKSAAEDPATRRLMEDMMIARFSQELGLNDEQTVLLVRKFNVFRVQLSDMRKQRAVLAREIKELLEKNKDDTAIDVKVQELTGLDLKLAQARVDSFKEASADLAPWQRAKLYLFASEFENELRGLVQKARERRRMMEGPPSMGPHPGIPGGPPDGRGAGRAKGLRRSPAEAPKP